MRIAVIGSLLAIIVFAPLARADFVMEAIAPATTAAPDAPETGSPLSSSAAATTPLRLPIAYGFGDQVPLSFAVRQIVPKAIKVSYGPGADPGAIVSWKGGQPWNQVLRAAVRPHGLQLVIGWKVIELHK